MPEASPQQEAWTQGYDAAEAHYKPLVERQRDRAEKAEEAIIEGYAIGLRYGLTGARNALEAVGLSVFGEELWQETVRRIQDGEL